MAKYGILEQPEGGLKGGLLMPSKKSSFLEYFSLICNVLRKRILDTET